LTGLINLVAPAVADGEGMPRSRLRLKDFCGRGIATKYSLNPEIGKNIKEFANMILNFKLLAH